MAEIDEAIAIMERARQIHEDWALHFEGNSEAQEEPTTLVKAVGDAKFHRRVMADYDKVLAVLYRVRGG